MKTLSKALTALMFMAAALFSVPAGAVQISVTHWGEQLYGLPWAVAMEKGYFKDAGLDITGIISSQGGGTTVRNVFGSKLPYGEVALSAAIAAANQGNNLLIVNAGVISVGDLLWVTLPDSPIKSIKDLEGHKLGYSRPKSVTDIVSRLALESQHVPLEKVERVAVGGIGSQLTALKAGGISAAFMSEPVWSKVKKDYRPVFYLKDVLPNAHITQTVGIVSRDFAKAHPDQVKALVEGRRKGVEYLYAHPKEAADILAKAYHSDPAIMEEAVRNMIAIQYWGEGKLDLERMNRMVNGMVEVGALDKPFDLSKVVDTSYLK